VCFARFSARLSALRQSATGAPALPAQVPGIGQPVVPPANAGPGDSSALAREATAWLAELIKINTTNPPGNEEAAAKYIAGILQKEGIKAELLPMAPGRSALVARLNASAFADPSKALLLVAHMDVVGVERSKWTVDPFGAVPKDGYVYGRGAIDDKGMLAANLAAFVYLKRANARLNRDVIFLATDDEEGFGDASMKTLIAKYWDKIAAKYSINEGGNVFVKKRQSAVRRGAGQRKSGHKRHGYGERDFGARLDSFERQPGNASGRSRGKNRKLQRAGAPDDDCPSLF
jgi:acetylornithine deacetylase/succinyl-diaminopimelate desuccinylase-like protein